MSGAALRRSLTVLVVAISLAAFGCMLGSRVNTTQISVQFSGERMLHIVGVPRTLPDGTPTTKQLTALLSELSKAPGGYTLIQGVANGFTPPGQQQSVQETTDLLFVMGSPQMKLYLERKLYEEFKQEYPLVISVPLQSVATVAIPQQPTEEAKPEAKPEAAPATEAAPEKAL